MLNLQGRLNGRPRLGQRLARRRFGPIGLQFAAEGLHLVQFEQPDGANPRATPRLTAVATFAGVGVDRGIATARRLRAPLEQLLRTQGFHGRAVVANLNVEQVKIVVMHYQLGPEGGHEAAIAQRMASRLKGDLAGYVIDYVPVRQAASSGEEHVALVAAAPREEVIQTLEFLRIAGLQVRALEIGPVAINRIVSHMPNHRIDDNTLVLNIGRTQSFLTVMSGRRLLFDQSVAWGEQLLIESLASQLEITSEIAQDLLYQRGFLSISDGDRGVMGEAEAEIYSVICEILRPQFLGLVDSINKALVYAAAETRGKAIHMVYLSGGVARWPGVAGFLNGLVDIPVHVLDPVSCFRAADDAVEPQPALAVAAGLALREFAEGP